MIRLVYLARIGDAATTAIILAWRATRIVPR